MPYLCVGILKKNIMDVIMQPCNSDYPKRIVPNGLSEDGTYIMVKTRCDDSSSQIRLKWCNNGVYEDVDFVEEILERIRFFRIEHDQCRDKDVEQCYPKDREKDMTLFAEYFEEDLHILRITDELEHTQNLEETRDTE